MISSQRKAHKYVWLVLALVLAVLLILTIKDLDFTTNFGIVENEQLRAQLNDDTIIIQLSKPFQNPSMVVYELDSGNERGKVLGQLHGIGSYTFKASPKVMGIVVVDEIKKKELYKIQF